MYYNYKFSFNQNIMALIYLFIDDLDRSIKNELTVYQRVTILY